MRKIVLLLMVAMLVLVGCLEEVDPTPTQEVDYSPGWSTKCVDGRDPENSNPCLFGDTTVELGEFDVTYPNLMGFWFGIADESIQDEINYTGIYRRGDAFVIELAYFQGVAGLNIPLLQLEQAQCYNVAAGIRTNISYNGSLADATDNFYVVLEASIQLLRK